MIKLTKREYNILVSLEYDLKVNHQSIMDILNKEEYRKLLKKLVLNFSKKHVIL